MATVETTADGKTIIRGKFTYMKDPLFVLNNNEALPYEVRGIAPPKNETVTEAKVPTHTMEEAKPAPSKPMVTGKAFKEPVKEPVKAPMKAPEIKKPAPVPIIESKKATKPVKKKK